MTYKANKTNLCVQKNTKIMLICQGYHKGHKDITKGVREAIRNFKETLLNVVCLRTIIWGI